uniref:Uncharacterized protein n=1 Tax=Romanomermis culicivorax TaxID=13658 RepID=A0A915IDA8_ROMCU
MMEEMETEKRPKWLQQLEGSKLQGIEMVDERRMLSRYGIWMMVGLCTPDEQTPLEPIGHLMSMLFQWFGTTALLPSDNTGVALEQLKNEFVCGWLKKVMLTHYEVFVQCLTPKPPDYAKVGGQWDKLSRRLDQLKEGLSKILALIPYDLISFELLTDYDITIPLDTVLNFYSLLAKYLGPIPPDMPKRQRAQKDSIGDHEGLQVDEEARPMSPLSQDGCPTHHQTVFDSDDENNASIFVVLLDILQRQFELNDVSKLISSNSNTISHILTALNDLLKAPWFGQHVCDDPTCDDFVDCLYCRDTTIFYQLLTELIQKLCPKDAVKIEMPPEEDYDWEEAVRQEASLAEQSEQEAESKNQSEEPEQSIRSLSAQPSIETKSCETTPRKISKLEVMPPVMMATLEEEALAMEFVAVLPTEQLETEVAQAVTLTEPDVDLATCKVITTTLVDDHSSTSPQIGTAPETIETHPDPDVIFFILHTMKYLCLHAEALNNAHKEHRGFLIWAQENILISKYWQVMQAQYSQVAQMCVPLILHCLTLPSGADVFWKVVNEDFTADDWKIRSAAVEKVTCLGRFIDPVPVRGNSVLQGALANAFSFLIAALQDPNAVVAQRATMYLETIKPTSLKCLCSCLEAQFDMVVADRPLIIHRFMLLSGLLADQPILNWEFFLQRFDALSIEAQIQLEKSGEIAFPQDLMHSDPMSDLYQRKLIRARQALEQNDSVRSIVKHLDKALNYQKNLAINAQSKIAK